MLISCLGLRYPWPIYHSGWGSGHGCECGEVGVGVGMGRWPWVWRKCMRQVRMVITGVVLSLLGAVADVNRATSVSDMKFNFNS